MPGPVVGTAEVLILANDTGFESSLRDGAAGGLAGLDEDVKASADQFSEDLAAGGAVGGTAVGEEARSGARTGLEDLTVDADAAGANLATGLTDGGKKGGEGLAEGLTGAGTKAGDEVDKELDDSLTDTEEKVETHGESMGGQLTKGMSKGLSGLANMLGAGFLLPVSEGVDKAGVSMAKASTDTESFTDKVAKLGGGIALGTGIAAVGVAALSLKMGTDFQASVTKMAAAGDISIAKANDIGQAFLHSGQGTIFSAQQQVAAFGQVAGQMAAVQGHALSTSQTVSFMGHAMDLAEESGSSLSSSVGDLSQVMQTFQVPLSQTGSLTTDLFNASRTTGISIDSLTSTMDRLKARLGVTAPSVADMSTLLVDVSEHGVTGSRGLMVLNTAMTTLLKPTTAQAQAQVALKAATDALPPSLDKLAASYQQGNMTAAQVTAATKGLSTAQADAWKQFTTASETLDKANTALSATGVKVDDASGKFVGFGSVIAQLEPKLRGETQAQQLSTLSTVLGTTANKALLDTVLAGPAAWDKAQRAVTSAAAAHHALEVQQKTLGHEMESLKVSAEDMTTELGVHLVPIAQRAVGDFTSFASALLANKPALIAIAAVVGTVLVSAMGLWVAKLAQGAVESVVDFGKMIAASATWIASTAADMATWVSLYVPAFAGWVAETSSSVAESTGLWAMYFAKWLAETASSVATWVGVQALGLASTLKDMVAWTVEHSVLAATFIAENAAMAASAIAAFVAENLATLGIAAAIAALIAVVVYLATHWKQTWDVIKDVALDVWHFLDGVWHDIEAGVSKAWGDIMDFLKKWWPALLVVVTGGVALIPLLLIKYWTQIKDDIVTAWTDILGFFKTWWNNLVTNVTTFVVDIAETLLRWWQTIDSDVHEVWGDVTQFISAIPARILGFFAAAGTLLLNVGREILTGLWTGIVTEWHVLGDVGSIIEGWLTSALADAVDWLEHVGEMIIQGLVDGIKNSAHLVTDAVNSIVSGVKSVVTLGGLIGSPSPWFTEVGHAINQGLANGITESTSTSLSAVNSLTRQVRETPVGLGPLVGGLASGGSSSSTGAGSSVIVESGAFTVHVHGAADPGVAGAATTAVKSGITELTQALQAGRSPARSL